MITIDPLLEGEALEAMKVGDGELEALRERIDALSDRIFDLEERR